MFSRVIGSCLSLILVVAGASACASNEGDRASQEGDRTVEHAMGSTDVPERANRVVVLDTGELDDATALGIKPIGAVTTDVDDAFIGYLDDQTEGIESVGTINEPNLEKIAQLDPDLILSSKVRHEKLYDQLSKIAPTVFTETVGQTWKENFELHGEALGRTEQAAALIEGYEREAVEVGEQAEPGSVVSYVRFLPGQTRLYSDKSFVGVILSDIGATVPETAQGADTFVELSAENLGLADTDQVITSTFGPQGDTDQGALTNGPLWRGLDAVKEHRVSTVDDDLVSGIGIQAATALLDDLKKALV